MKTKFINKANVRGYVFSHSLEMRETGPNSKNPGTEYIRGTLDIATDEDGVSVVPVSFTYVTAKFKSGKDNDTFVTLKKIIDDDISFSDKVAIRVDGDLEVNDFYNRDGELVTYQRVRGGFVHFIDAGPVNPSAKFEAETVLMHIADAENEDGSEYRNLKGFVFNFRNDVSPVTFTVTSTNGIKFFDSCDISADEPYFGKVWGDIVCNTVTKEIETEDTNVGFGEPVVQETSRTYRSWDIAGANVNLGLDDDTITIDELKAACVQREAYLEEEKSRYEARTASANTKSSSDNDFGIPF